MEKISPYQDEMECKTFNKWKSFVSYLEESSFVDGNYLYRGQANPQWQLISYPYRRGEKVDGLNHFIETIMLQNILNDFRNAVVGLNPDIPDHLSDPELWMYGRHYGLHTPLLDWTYSPYIAAFFAFCQYLDLHSEDKKNIKYAVVYQLANHFSEADQTKGQFIKNYNGASGPSLEIDAELVLLSERKNYYTRQKAQRGVFTFLQQEPSDDIMSYLKRNQRFDILSAFLLKVSEVEQGLASLSRMNINYASLYPDIIGAVMHANQDFKIKFKASNAKAATISLSDGFRIVG